LDGVSGDEVDHQEDEAYYQPDYWEGVEDALEEKFQLLVPSCQLPSQPEQRRKLLAKPVAARAAMGSFASLRMTGG